jgi:hypothetical protein
MSLTVSIFIGRQSMCEGRYSTTGKPSPFHS